MSGTPIVLRREKSVYEESPKEAGPNEESSNKESPKLKRILLRVVMTAHRRGKS